MTPFKVEHAKVLYYADFIIYALLIGLMLGLLIGYVPRGEGWYAASAAAAGLSAWPLVEYLIHRFVLHQLEPFKGLHAEHHRRPRAFICTPTLVSASAIFALVFLPAWAAWDPWVGTGLLLGVTVGYLGFSCVHHTVHHWRSDHPWLRTRKRLHNAHHRRSTVNYGVSTAFWDDVLGTRSG